MRSSRLRAIAIVTVMITSGERALCQQSAASVVHPELHADVIQGSATLVHGGVGLNAAIGTYARLGAVLALGARVDDGAGANRWGTGRLDIFGRFLLDPLRSSRWGLSGGGGVSVLAIPGERTRPYLLALLELEGPRSAGGASPIVGLGLGGGLRLGGGVRWGSVERR